MPLRPLAGSPHGPRFSNLVKRDGEPRKARVTTSYEEWGAVFWERLSSQQQQEALGALIKLHRVRCELASLKPIWHHQALILLQAKGFGPDSEEYPRGRPDLAGGDVRVKAIGWAIVESGYALGTIHFEPRAEHPALVAFAALGL